METGSETRKRKEAAWREKKGEMKEKFSGRGDGRDLVEEGGNPFRGDPRFGESQRSRGGETRKISDVITHISKGIEP